LQFKEEKMRHLERRIGNKETIMAMLIRSPVNIFSIASERPASSASLIKSGSVSPVILFFE
jgi:hypothetical protein